jgi:hypothetical protein
MEIGAADPTIACDAARMSAVRRASLGVDRFIWNPALYCGSKHATFNHSIE